MGASGSSIGVSDQAVINHKYPRKDTTVTPVRQAFGCLFKVISSSGKIITLSPPD
jgi:hypothetical protein